MVWYGMASYTKNGTDYILLILLLRYSFACLWIFPAIAIINDLEDRTLMVTQFQEDPTQPEPRTKKIKGATNFHEYIR